MTRSEARWIKILGDNYNKDIPLDVQIAEYEREHKPAPAPKNGSRVPAKCQSIFAHDDLEMFGRWIGEAINEQVAPLLRRIEDLEKRDWAGVWQAGKSYAKGAIITKGGSAWVATCNYPEGEPGESKGWRLFVKRGRDGRDARSKP